MHFKKFLRRAAAFVTVCALNTGIIMSYSPIGAEDLTVDEIKDKISQIQEENAARREEIERIDGDISEQKENLEKVNALLGEQKQLVDYYNNLVYYKKQDITEVEGKIADLELDIDELDSQIKTAEKDIEELEAQNADNLEKFAQIIRTMYTTGNTDMFGVLAGSTDFYQLMVSSEVIGNITEKNLEFMNALKKDIEKLSSDKKQLETDKANLQASVEKLDSEKQTLLDEQTELEGLLYDSASAADSYKQDYDKYQSAIDSLENQQSDLSYLISVSEADIDAYEEQIKEIIKQQTNPDKVYQEGDWIWPVPGRSYISCYFGWDYELGRWHKGVDIGDAGIYGDYIRASKAGTVIVAESSYIPGYSYGMYVVVDHGGGYTSTYAHMSAVNVYVGQEVAQGDVLGCVGNTGYSTGPHLHFEIRLNGEPQDPFGYVEIA